MMNRRRAFPILVASLTLVIPTITHAAPDFRLVGFATMNGGTTGGQGGDTVVVKSYADLKTHAEGAAKKVILVEGTITNGVGGGKIEVKSNKTIQGVGTKGFLSGVGLEIDNANNIIVRNLKMTLVGTTTPTSVNGGDLIVIQGTSKNIWIDHNELYEEDITGKYDGLVDIRDQTGFITVSWNLLRDHHKGGIVGAGDDDIYADRKVTFHHNYYKNVRIRIPMYRGAVGHFLNNYIVGADGATEIRANTCLRVEKNYYEALNLSIYTPSESVGKAERIDNIEVSRKSRAYPAACKADIPYDYSKVLTTTTSDVKTIVPQYAGIGKIESAPSNNLPVFSSSKSFSHAENGTVVTQCKATDADGDAVSYAITAGEDSARFSIDRTTGILSFRKAPDFEAPSDQGGDNIYKVTVSASDGKGATTQSIAIQVTDVQETVSAGMRGGSLVPAKVRWLDARGLVLASGEQRLDPSMPRPEAPSNLRGAVVAEISFAGQPTRAYRTLETGILP